MINKEEIFESEVFTLTDEDGNESEFEILGTLELDGNNYVALIPIEDSAEEQDEYVILRLEQDEQEGGEVLVTIDDDEEFDRVADEFEDAFMNEFDCDANGYHSEDYDDNDFSDEMDDQE